MKTYDEILKRIEAVKKKIMSKEIDVLLMCLPFEKAKPFLKPNTPESIWVQNPRDRESILKFMEKFMPYAWEQANQRAPLSACTNMDYYTSWIWLIGDDEAIGDLTDYEFYGKDNLVRICEHYGWDHTQWDNGVRTNG